MATSLHFIASVQSNGLKDGLTDRQSKAANKILQRVYQDFKAGVLDCQMNEKTCPLDEQFDESVDPKDLATMKPKGRV